MLKFSVKEQVFYDTTLKYSYELPNDLIDVPEERHAELVSYLNEGKRIDYNLNISESKPTKYHTWKDGLGWVDSRSDDQKIIDELESLSDLNQKQFRLMLLKNNITQDKVISTLSNIKDKSEEYLIVFNYGDSFDIKSDFIGTLMPLLGITRSALIVMWKQGMTL